MKRLLLGGIVIGIAVGVVACSGGSGPKPDANTMDMSHSDNNVGTDVVLDQGNPLDTDTQEPECTNLCTQEGATKCEGAGYVQCADTNDDGCLEWSQVIPCKAGEGCENGKCVSKCQNQECTVKGARKCKDSQTVVKCDDYNNDGCLEWGGEEKCDTGQVCSNGYCSVSCTNECTTKGAKKCDGNSVVTCDDYDNNGCLEWGNPQDCGDKVCSNGFCTTQCENECTSLGSRTCEGNGYKICKDWDNDGCLEWSTVTPCQPDEVCSNGFCKKSCQNECTVAGAKKCVLNSVSACKDTNNDGCLEWSTPDPCPQGTTCNAGVCETQCKSECTVKGAKKCDEAGNVVECVDVNGQGCLKWGTPVPCESPTVCSEGACKLNCTDECPSKDAKQCVIGVDNQFQVCGDWDSDGCLEWGTAQNCPEGKVCSGGDCVTTCQDECPKKGDKECDGNGWHECGDWDGDGCLEWGTITYCAEFEECKDGACVQKEPPAKVLISEVLYDTPGYPDTGSFIELYGPANTDLTGYSIVGINGSNGKQYAQIPLSGHKIGSDGFFVVVHPDAPADTLAQADMTSEDADFQNGPDSIQVKFGTKVVDALAYGTFNASQYPAGEGNPVARVSAAGHSLGRDANETDTDDNATDFHEYDVPTPGAPNIEPDKPPVAQMACPDPAVVGDEVTFDARQSYDEDGDIVEYSFDFGDGNSTSGDNPVVKYVYTEAGSYVVTLTVKDDKGATAQTTCNVTISTPQNQPPTAKLQCPSGELKSGEELTFDASGSSDPDGQIVDYVFDFGDNTHVSGTQAQQTHTYQSAGDYTVTLTVKDDKGATAQDQCTITVKTAGAPDLTITQDTELCGRHEYGKLSIMAGAKVTCSQGWLDIVAKEVVIDPASSIDLSNINKSTDNPGAGGNGRLCQGNCGCPSNVTGGGGGGNATAGGGTQSTTYGYNSDAHCYGSCLGASCNGATGGKEQGSEDEYDTDATIGGSGGEGGEWYGTNPGGGGGGSIRIFATTSLTVQGKVLADGENGQCSDAGSGGGAGGSIVLAAPALSITGEVSAAGGQGGKCEHSYKNGGNGGKGWIKLLHGANYTNNGTISTTGSIVKESVMPPVLVTSSTHPDQELYYNDTFQKFDVSWEKAFPEATGYWYALNNDEGFVLTPQNGTYTEQLSVSFPASTFTSSGTWYFRIISTDNQGNIGSVAYKFRIHINDKPPVLASSSHPDPTKWYQGTAVAMSWSPPEGVSKESFSGFYYRLDRTSNTSPENAKDTWTYTPNWQVVVTKDADGNPITSFAYHFHLVPVDTMGNITKHASHFLIQVGNMPAKTNFFGYVKDASGNPIEGASVRLEPYGHNKTTDQNGYFIMNIYKGPYTITVTKSGYQEFQTHIDVGTVSTPYNVTLTQ